MSKPEVVNLTEVATTPVPSRSTSLGSAEKARRALRVSQAVSVAYHQARALSELMSMIVRDIESLPVDEREAVRRANGYALDAYSRLNSIIIDEGNVPREREL